MKCVIRKKIKPVLPEMARKNRSKTHSLSCFCAKRLIKTKHWSSKQNYSSNLSCVLQNIHLNQFQFLTNKTRLVFSFFFCFFYGSGSAPPPHPPQQTELSLVLISWASSPFLQTNSKCILHQHAIKKNWINKNYLNNICGIKQRHWLWTRNHHRP